MIVLLLKYIREVIRNTYGPVPKDMKISRQECLVELGAQVVLNVV